MTKKAKLAAELKNMKSVLVAFSGGVDSAFLLAVAQEALGKNVLAVTAVSPIHSLRERADATEFTTAKDIPHLLIPTGEMSLPEFVANNPDRCYHCKRALCKTEIRNLAKAMGLPQWNRPSGACLASRLPYGSAVTEKKLKMIERAEAFLVDRGLRTLRVRHHGDLARIEIGAAERSLVLKDAVRKDIINAFRSIGFDHIALDLEEFVSGKMNRSLHHRCK